MAEVLTVAAEKFTVAAVKNYKPSGKRRFIRDGGAQSLYLVIQPSGHKSWMMRFRRPNGAPAKIVLGPLDLSGRELSGDPQVGQPLSLVAARLLAAEIHRQRALDHDPIADHKAARRRRRTEVEDRAVGTFGACLRRFVEEHARPGLRRWRGTVRLLGLSYPKDGGEPTETKGGLAERWADRDVRAIDGHDIFGAVEEAHRKGTPGITPRNRGLSEARARDLHSALSSMFSWMQGPRRRMIDKNPCAEAWESKSLPPRERTLDEQELRLFWLACETADQPHDPRGLRPYRAILRLLLLTGQRLNEVAGMTRTELSDDGTVWTIPAARAKNKREHKLPLSPLAREIIASVPGESELVFTTTGYSPPSGWSKVKRRVDVAMLAIARRERGKDATVLPWHIHDLRRTLATGLQKLGVELPVTEKVLNHVSGSFRGIVGIYQKHTYADEQRVALERWAVHVSGIVSGQPAKVTQLRPRAKKA
jgi:integrase